MNRRFGVPALAGPDRLEAGHRTGDPRPGRFLVPMRGERAWRLSMNRVAADVSPLTYHSTLNDASVRVENLVIAGAGASFVIAL
jgi:hypothetical protein